MSTKVEVELKRLSQKFKALEDEMDAVKAEVVKLRQSKKVKTQREFPNYFLVGLPLTEESFLDSEVLAMANSDQEITFASEAADYEGRNLATYKLVKQHG